ncbi:MAG: nuclear transport factor 2 family protein [Burkholderiales bacterium]|nr:nuclear transport factor 2 family protein [Burkholderiales bacterium]
MQDLTPNARALAEMLAKAQVREVLESYFHALDAREEERLAACFTPDAVATHHSGSDSEFTLTGNAEIARYFVALMGTFDASNHNASNAVIRASGDSASADTFAIATVVAADRIRVRGLRYLDELVRSAGRWRIARRTHIPLWQYETAPVKPHLPR